MGALAAALLFAGVAAAAAVPARIVTGQDAGWPDVRGWDPLGSPSQLSAPWGRYPLAFSPYPTYQDGVRVAVGDVDGDGRPEILTAPGKSAFTELRVFDGRSFHQTGSLLPFTDAAWYEGAYLAAGDTNGDGRSEIVEGLGPGCCTSLHVLDALSGKELSGFFPWGDSSQVGARVTAGDVNGDGRAEILAARIGDTRIDFFAPTGGKPFRSVEAFPQQVMGGAAIAAGNLLGDARAEIVAAAPTSTGAQVKIIDPASGATLASFYPYGSEEVTALEVALGDLNGDGSLDLVVSANTPDGTQVKALDAGGMQLDSFYVLDPGIVPGASLAAGDLDGDGKAEIVLGGGPTPAPWPPVANGPDQRVAVYRPDGTLVGGFTAYPGLFQGGVRVALADVNQDRQAEVLTAPGPGLEPEIGVFSQEFVNGRDRGTRLAHFLAFEPSFEGGVTIAAGDVSGDGAAEIVVGAGPGRAGEVRTFDGTGRELASFFPFGPGYTGGVSVAAGDLDDDGHAEIVAGTLSPPARVRTFDGGVPWGPLIAPPWGASGSGVEVGTADLRGDGRSSVVVAPATGPVRDVCTMDPASGELHRCTELDSNLESGLRVAGGDLDQDGRDEIVVTSGWGGDGQVRVLDQRLRRIRVFAAYPWPGWGMNVGVLTRIGFAIAAEPRTVRLTARRRARVVVASFRDSPGVPGRGRLRATIDWGDGTRWSGVVLTRGRGLYDVRSRKRYARPGRYPVVVALDGRELGVSVARSTAIVRRART